MNSVNVREAASDANEANGFLEQGGIGGTNFILQVSHFACRAMALIDPQASCLSADLL